MGVFYGIFVLIQIISVIGKTTAAIKRLMTIGKLGSPPYEYVELFYTVFVFTCYCIMISIYSEDVNDFKLPFEPGDEDIID